MEEQVAFLTEQVNQLREQFESLGADTRIPVEIGEAMKIRVLEGTKGVNISTVSATAHNKTVNESGSSTYDVMNKPDGFLQVTIKGTIYVIPYFI